MCLLINFFHKLKFYYYEKDYFNPVRYIAVRL